jgi:hypothetical protein
MFPSKAETRMGALGARARRVAVAVANASIPLLALTVMGTAAASASPSAADATADATTGDVSPASSAEPTRPAEIASPGLAVIEPQAAVLPVSVLASAGDAGRRAIPVGAFCPPRNADPLREASTFGVSALLMWALARRRLARIER